MQIAAGFTNPDATVLGQLSSVLIVITFVAITTSIVWIVLKESIGIRVSAETEEFGIDKSSFVLET